MADYGIASMQEFLSVVAEFDENTLYRGHLREQWRLVPKVARYSKYSRELEADILSLFQLHARPYVATAAGIPASQWDWVALAQHHGLATRLLDWSRNPLVAAFFAVESFDGDDYDSVVYALKYAQGDVVDTRQVAAPWDVSRLHIHHPSHITQRIAAQAGAFTVSADPTIPLNSNLKSIVISRVCRAEMRRWLRVFGVHHGTLFPDLAGQARFVMELKTQPAIDYPQLTDEQAAASFDRLQDLIKRSRSQHG